MHSLLESKPVAQREANGSPAAELRATQAADRWEQRVADLLAFKAVHGHCNVPSGYREDPSLAIWVFNSRRQRKLGVLSDDRIKQLDEIGFSWSVRTRRFVARDWDAMVAELKAFRHEHGHCNIPHSSPEHRDLATWLHATRCNRRSGQLAAKRVRQLNALGVVWEPQQTHWKKMLTALAEYRRRHGDCNVPYGWPENPRLAKWVKGIRSAQKRGDLDDKRIGRLEKIGFTWERTGDSHWEEMYGKVAYFQQLHGHCRISTLSEEHGTLGNWVHTQRTLRKQGRLEPERIAQLDAIGFTWDYRREQWDTLFAALEEYQRATGHCDVPQLYAENRKLGNWVMVQRAAYKAGRLDGMQIERLSAIGFRFSIAGDRLLVAAAKKPRRAAQPKTRRAA
jgi:hypothetical protein